MLQYAGLLMGISNTFATIPGIVSPSITGAIVTHKVSIGVLPYLAKEINFQVKI